MCSRFELNAPLDEIAHRFGLPLSLNIAKKLELRPMDKTLVITSQGPRFLSWGLTVDWNSKPIINARCETLAKKKSFSPHLAFRCLIPATAYFEWRKNGHKKLKNRISILNQYNESLLFAFAGLFVDEYFTIITCPPTKSISHIHNRMPVILDAKREALWINTKNTFESVSKILVPYQTKRLKAEEQKPRPDPQLNLF